MSNDLTLIVHRIGNQTDRTAGGCVKQPVVDDSAPIRNGTEVVATIHEDIVVDAQRGGKQAANIHLRICTKNHAVGITQKHPAISIDIAKNLAGVLIVNAV